MKIEERLHDALHGYADVIEPEAGSWSKIAAHFDDEPAPRRPRARGRALVFAALALLTVVVIVAALVRDTDHHTEVATSPRRTTTDLPQRILAVTDRGEPVVLASKTGGRDFTYGATSIAEGTQIAVSPDERDAYLVTGNGNEGCAGHSILALQIGSGSGSRVVATNATDPAVSPDGRYLAYLHCSPDSGNRANHIVLRDLTTGTERVTSAPDGTFFINRVEFAPDAHRVIFNLFDDAQGRATLRELNVVDGEAPPGRDVGPAAGEAVWVGLRGNTGEYLAVKGSPPSVLSLRGPAPFTASPLFTVPAIPSQVVADQSGRHILAVVDHALYRWSVGDERATKIADNVIGAAWIPDARQAPPAPAAAAPLPNGVVVARNGALDVLGAADGAQHSSLGAFPNVSRIGASPDGRELIYASSGPSPACGGGPGPTVKRLATARLDAPDASQLVVGGSGSPAVSPDGEFVAYGIVCDGIEPGLTNLHSGANYRFDPFPASGSGAAEIVQTEPLAWAPDSKRLLYRLALKGDAAPHFYVATLVPVSHTEVIEIPVGSAVTAGAFMDNDVLAVAEKTNAGSTVRTFDLGNQGTNTLFALPRRITSLIADRSGRHFLALLDDGALYRWTTGDPAPTRLAEGVTAAAWIPWS